MKPVKFECRCKNRTSQISFDVIARKKILGTEDCKGQQTPEMENLKNLGRLSLDRFLVILRHKCEYREYI
jgi:hypothetical protein